MSSLPQSKPQQTASPMLSSGLQHKTREEDLLPHQQATNKLITASIQPLKVAVEPEHVAEPEPEVLGANTEFLDVFNASFASCIPASDGRHLYRDPEKLTCLQLCDTPPLPPMDLRPLRRVPYVDNHIRAWHIIADKHNAYHPSRWEPIQMQHVGGTDFVALCGPTGAEPLVEVISLDRYWGVTRLEQWRRFGGKCPTDRFITLQQWVHWHLHKNTKLAKSWGDTLVFPQAVYQVVLQPVDLIKEHHLLGKDLVSISVEHLNFLVPNYRHLEPAVLDLVLCQVWHDMGRTYRNQHLSRHSKYLYKIYTKLPKTYVRYQLTYHSEAPCYHT